VESKTKAAVIISELGYLGCEACRLEGKKGGLRLEGHHPGKKVMNLSDYRHCVKQEYRHKAIEQLTQEVRHRLRLLCKKHHEEMHHANPK